MRKYISVLLVASALFSCAIPADLLLPAPEAATLLAPATNEACAAGTVLSDSITKIKFSWTSVTTASSYDITIKNLLTGTSVTQGATTNSIEVAVKRNTPFSWFVTSKSTTTTKTSDSNIWKFYTTGPVQIFYTPFPAEAISPTIGQQIAATAGKISLRWKGTDVDNDISSYDVYFGTDANPPILQSKLAASTTSIADISVVIGTKYYWKVVTKDAKGNSSSSEIFQFTVK
jgi:hypothetical protein